MLFARGLLMAGALLVGCGWTLSALRSEERAVTLVEEPSAPVTMRQFRLEDGRFALTGVTLERAPSGDVTQCAAELTCFLGPTFRETQTVSLEINRPLDWKGWRVYLMDAREVLSPSGGWTQMAELSMRKDPGVPWAFTGYALLIGAAVLGVFARKEDAPCA